MMMGEGTENAVGKIGGTAGKSAIGGGKQGGERCIFMGVGMHGCAEVVPLHEERSENGGGIEGLRCIVSGQVGKRGSRGIAHDLNGDLSKEILLGKRGGCHSGEKC